MRLDRAARSYAVRGVLVAVETPYVFVISLEAQLPP